MYWMEDKKDEMLIDMLNKRWKKMEELLKWLNVKISELVKNTLTKIKHSKTEKKIGKKFLKASSDVSSDILSLHSKIHKIKIKKIKRQIPENVM